MGFSICHRRMGWLRPLIALSAVLCGPHPVLAATDDLPMSEAIATQAWQVEIEPRPQDSFEHIAYRLWIPPGLARIKGLIVFEHGCGYGASVNGLRHVEDLQYRALANKWQMGLVAARQFASGENCWLWMNVEHGSADGFLRALSRLATLSGHSEVNTVPWALWGHSGGGAWVTGMTARFPQRVIATFARSGAFGGDGNVIGPASVTLKPTPAMRAVPMMFCYGAKEENAPSEMMEFISHVRQVYAAGQTGEARWAITVDPVTGHENGDTRYLTIRFFDAVFQHTPTLGGRAEPDRAWWGDARSLEIGPIAHRREPSADLPLSWLVSEQFAHDWQEFARTGLIRDTTPPPPPTAITVRAVNGAVVVSWNAEADLESGIQEFRIYGDGEFLGRTRSLTPEANEAPFQHWNYFDQPELDPAQNPMRFLWRGLDHKVLSVTTINHAGLESTPGRSPRAAP